MYSRVSSSCVGPGPYSPFPRVSGSTAEEKSASLTVARLCSRLRMMFEGLMSRCVMLRWCSTAAPSRTCLMSTLSTSCPPSAVRICLQKALGSCSTVVPERVGEYR
jgi:hypothetical protein